MHASVYCYAALHCAVLYIVLCCALYCSVLNYPLAGCERTGRRCECPGYGFEAAENHHVKGEGGAWDSNDLTVTVVQCCFSGDRSLLGMCV